MSPHKFLCLAALICILSGLMLRAEDTAPPSPPPGDAGGGAPDGGGRGGGPGRGQWNPQQMMQRMLDQVKETLGVSDEDWKVLQPKVEAVQKLAAQIYRPFMRGRRSRNSDDNQPKNEIDTKMQELKTLAENKEADPKELKAKMEEVRVAREKIKLDLKKAQDELRELLTQHQEAQMILLGLLE